MDIPSKRFTSLFLSLGSGLSYRLFGITFHQVLNIPEKHNVQPFLGIEDWIDHSRLDIATQMVHVSVFCFVSTYSAHQVKDRTAFTQFPVGTTNGWCKLCAPVGKIRSFRSLFNGLDNLCVGRARYEGETL